MSQNKLSGSLPVWGNMTKLRELLVSLCLLTVVSFLQRQLWENQLNGSLREWESMSSLIFM